MTDATPYNSPPTRRALSPSSSEIETVAGTAPRSETPSAGPDHRLAEAEATLEALTRDQRHAMARLGDALNQLLQLRDELRRSLERCEARVACIASLAEEAQDWSGRVGQRCDTIERRTEEAARSLREEMRHLETRLLDCHEEDATAVEAWTAGEISRLELRIMRRGTVLLTMILAAAMLALLGFLV